MRGAEASEVGHRHQEPGAGPAERRVAQRQVGEVAGQPRLLGLEAQLGDHLELARREVAAYAQRHDVEHVVRRQGRQSEGQGDLVLDQPQEVGPARGLHHEGGQRVAERGVADLGARRCQQRIIDEQREDIVAARVGALGDPSARGAGIEVLRLVVPHAAAVGQQLAHRGRAVVRGQVGQPVGDRHVEIEQAARHQPRGDRPGDRLADRSEAEHVVGRGRHIELEVGLADRIAPDHSGPVGHRERQRGHRRVGEQTAAEARGEVAPIRLMHPASRRKCHAVVIHHFSGLS